MSRPGLVRAGCLLVLTLAAIAVGTSEAAVWTPIGPSGADVRAVAADPNQPSRVYAATRYGGMYVSTQGGHGWTLGSSGLPKDIATGSYEGLFGVTVDPVDGRVYAAGARELWLSTNGGGSWSMFEHPSGSVGNFTHIYLDPDDHLKLTVQNRVGVFVYDFVGGDTNRSWAKAPGIDTSPIFDLERAPSNADVFYTVASYQYRLFRSDDRAASFSEVGSLPGTDFRDLAVDSADPSRLYLSLDTGCYLSVDGGQNWTRIDDPADAAEIDQFVMFDQGVLAVGRGGLFSNAAAADKLAKVAGFYYTNASGAMVRSDGTFLLASRMGVFEGSDAVLGGGGGGLQLLTEGMNAADISLVVPVPGSDIIYAAAGQSYDAGVFRSDAGGGFGTWELRSNGITNPDIRSIAVYPGNPDIVYVGTTNAIDETGENGSIFKTTDGGLNWADVTGGLPHVGARIIIAMLVHPTDPDIVYASVQAIEGGIYKSTDGGTTWTRDADGLESMPLTPGHEDFHNYYAMLSMTFDPTNPSTIYIGAGGCWGGTYHSNDAAATWTRRSAGYMEYDSRPIDFGDPDFWFAVHLELFDIDVDPSNSQHIFATGARGDYVGFEGQVGILFESTDGGENWSLVRESSRSDYFQSPLTGLAMHAGRPGEVYVSTRDGVQTSSDGGNTWLPINEGLNGPALFSRSIAFDPDTPEELYLATAFGGVYRRTLGPVAVTLTHFEGAVTDAGSVVLNWGVADAVDHLGFHVEREVGDVRERLTDRPLGAGATAGEYRYEDRSPVPDRVNRYWLMELDRSGSETEYGPVDVEPTTLVVRLFALGAPSPNPLRASTRLMLSIPADGGAVSVRVFDAQGRLVSTLVEGELPAGRHPVEWGGVNDAGEIVGAGVYFIQARSGSDEQVRRVTVIR